MPNSVGSDPQFSDWIFKGFLFLIGLAQALFFFILNGMKTNTTKALEKAEKAQASATSAAATAHKIVADQAAHNAETFARRDDVGAMKSEILGAISDLSAQIRDNRSGG